MLGYYGIGEYSLGTAPSEALGANQPVATIPSAPRSVISTPGNYSITVSFVGPLSDGGSPITSYVVKLSTGEQQSVSASPATFGGLSAGVARSAQVAAVNEVGQGPFSGASNQATPLAPAPVQDIDANSVPKSRWVMFEGSRRVVRFEGSDNEAGI